MEGCATFFKNEKSTFSNMPKSLYYFEKILFALKRLRDCLEIAKVVLEKEILRMKVVVPSGLTEKHIQQITCF
jgi:hypothetical protein